MQKKDQVQKQNILLPVIKPRSLGLSFKKQAFFTQPKMSKILYSPACSPDRPKNKMQMISAFMENKSYQEYVDDSKQRQISAFLRDTQISTYVEREENFGRSSLIGIDAQLRFYESYKNLNKIVGKKKLITEINKTDKDPSIVLLEATQRLGILPCKMGIVKTKGDSTEICITGQKFGDKYISAVADALKQAPMIEKLKLSNNRISDIGFTSLVNSLSHSIIKLDLSYNKIANIQQKFLNVILQHEARLQYINLEGNLLNDKSGESLCRSASYSKTLKYLNLRKNLLTKKSATAISQILIRSTHFEELYLGINRINEEGSFEILKALESNKSIKVFDYSMNKLGDMKLSCAKALSTVLSVNRHLLHVDFSSNNFTEEESKIIGEGLEKNNKIYGFHFGGNFGYIDSKGFYQAEEKEATSLHSLVNPSIQSYDIVFRRQNTSFDPIKFKNVCWICEGWYQQLFRFHVPEPASDGKNLVYLHFDFEQYAPRLINISEINVKYKTMVPPKKYKYFFTWNHQQFTELTAPKHQEKPISRHKEVVKDFKLDFPLYYTYVINHQETEIKVEAVSGRSGKAKKLVNDWDELIVEVLPRHVGLVTKKDKKPWSFKDSLWAKQWKLEDDAMTRNCFQKDWKNSKLMNFIKNQTQQEKMKTLLYSSYKLIKQLYRQYSSWSPFNGDIWAVSNNAFTEFCNQAKIISKDTPLKITDLTFITTNSMSGSDWKGNSLVPERGLIRFQFMQALVRLAEEKFKKNGHTDSILGSVQMMIRDHLNPLKDNALCTSQKWRLQKYFIQENDQLLRKYRPIFTQIYRKNSRMKVKPGNKPFMCLAEFKSIIERIGIAGSLILERDMFVAFNCSMMTQIDEIESERFMRMAEIQFIEAIARCAYILPNTCHIEDIFESPTPFYAKLQWIIHQLKKLCSDDIKDRFSDGVSIFKNEEM